MGDIMMFRVHFIVAGTLLLALSGAASAADLPAVKSGASNKVPACATPGRLMAFVGSRNGALADKFDGVATEYMRHGEAIGVRWDYAFFQMLVETANLKFPGDVNARQNNFAGLGATGGGEPGESFDTVSSGVKAHLQHIQMYAGEQVDAPIAERTRKVQEWGVLTSWQKSIKGPMTYTLLTRKWSPKDRGYARDIASVADAFYSKFCSIGDPRPELVAEARGQRGVTVEKSNAIAKSETGKRAIAEARDGMPSERSALGVTSIADTKPAPAANSPSTPPAAFTVLNSSEAATPAAEPAIDTTAEPAAETPGAQSGKAEIKLAAAATGAAAAGAKITADAAASAKAKDGDKSAGGCRVWQASYGGGKAVIIKAVSDGLVNYTVLDVNEGREQREVAAYIAAYAKNGSPIGEFPTQGNALKKAFEICPEG